MKKILLSGLISLQLCHLQAQQGTITYERKINLHRRMEDEQMKAMVPEFRISKHVLVFNDSITVYKAVKEDQAPDPFDNGSGGGPRVMIRIGPGENGVLYRNFATKQIEEQMELGDKNYIIDDTIKTQPWKLTDEAKTILNHNCKKAVMKSASGSNVSAWYAQDMPAPAGPENFSGLPGTVLAIDMNEGELVLTAIAITNAVDKKELAEPKTGKHITRAEFQKKMEEMMGPAGAGGRRVFKMN